LRNPLRVLLVQSGTGSLVVEITRRVSYTAADEGNKIMHAGHTVPMVLSMILLAACQERAAVAEASVAPDEQAVTVQDAGEAKAVLAAYEALRAALAADDRFEALGPVPRTYRRATRIGVRGVLYEKKTG
jgi:hypothetical protein